ncbi:LptA/OstA family protein [Deinococcus taeanensis]|uniref:LptA/OstA family protein n=1 Tax=Deinococcus taeanensis TaxID=2737050 RepID=UPI001CDB64A4|nr:LptA/OstA family protein [Deinococcus taeanensis]UBV42288.1 LptA/OstA family protein [Deinococcus taeanensis]
MLPSRWTVAARLTLALLLGGGAPFVWALAQTGPAAQVTPAPATSPAPDDAPAGAEAEQSSLELVRRSEKDGVERRIVIVKSGTSDETGIFAICTPQDGEPENTPTLAVFSEAGVGGVRLTIDKNVIRVPLAVVTQLPPRDGQEGSDGRVEASGGTARFLDEAPEGKTDRLSRCAVEAAPQAAPDTVLVTQGRTELKGQKLVYDSSDGVARIDGPIVFRRSSDTDPLTGKSDRIEVSVDDEKTTLVGNVVLNSAGGRVSEAARVEYDDTRNVARLYGTAEEPARSVKGNDTLRAGLIVYDLERNEVYAVKGEGGTITGEFMDGDPPAAPTPAAAPGRP